VCLGFRGHTGGEVYVYDETGTFPQRNTQLVTITRMNAGDPDAARACCSATGKPT